MSCSTEQDDTNFANASTYEDFSNAKTDFE